MARWANILAWVLLGMYAYSHRADLSTGSPGLVYFLTLKIAQQVLLILLDVEENSRRSARK